MKISREIKKAEAVRRMKILGIYSEAIRQFEEDDRISICEPPLGIFYWAKVKDLAHIRDFEENYNALVYLVVRSYFVELGTLDSYFYVSDHEQEWKQDIDMFGDGEAFVYVYNHDTPGCSEFGAIGISQTIAGGIKRTW